MIKFINVTKIYHQDTVVLQDISFEIKEGEFVSIVGKSGAGKTTLVRLMLGLEAPTSGEVYFKGEDQPGTIVDLNHPQFLGVRCDAKVHDNSNLDGHGISVGRMSHMYTSLTPAFQPRKSW